MESSDPLECRRLNLILALMLLSVVLGDKGARSRGFEALETTESFASWSSSGLLTSLATWISFPFRDKQHCESALNIQQENSTLYLDVLADWLQRGC